MAEETRNETQETEEATKTQADRKQARRERREALKQELLADLDADIEAYAEATEEHRGDLYERYYETRRIDAEIMRALTERGKGARIALRYAELIDIAKADRAGWGPLAEPDEKWTIEIQDGSPRPHHSADGEERTVRWNIEADLDLSSETIATRCAEKLMAELARSARIKGDIDREGDPAVSASTIAADIERRINETPLGIYNATMRRSWTAGRDGKRTSTIRYIEVLIQKDDDEAEYGSANGTDGETTTQGDVRAEA